MLNGLDKFVVFLHQTTKDIETNLSYANEIPVPSIFLTILQSFGKPGKTDKTTELELVLDLNNMDIAVCTET